MDLAPSGNEAIQAFFGQRHQTKSMWQTRLNVQGDLKKHNTVEFTINFEHM